MSPPGAGDLRPPGRLNLVLALLILVCAAALQFAAARAEPGWITALLALAHGLLLCPSYTLLHDCEHRSFHADRRLNDAAGQLLAWLFPCSFTFLRTTHLGHHKRNRSDGELFDLYYPDESRAWKTFRFYWLYVGFFWTLVPLGALAVALWPPVLKSALVHRDPSSAAMADGLGPRHLPAIRVEVLGALLAHAVAFWALDLRWWSWGALYAGWAFCWSSTNYLAHAFSDRDTLSGAFNLSLPRWAELGLLHFNWHLAHHQHPAVSWIHLPRLGDPSRPPVPYARAWLRFWRGPRRVTQPSPRPDLDPSRPLFLES